MWEGAFVSLFSSFILFPFCLFAVISMQTWSLKPSLVPSPGCCVTLVLISCPSGLAMREFADLLQHRTSSANAHPTGTLPEPPVLVLSSHWPTQPWPSWDQRQLTEKTQLPSPECPEEKKSVAWNRSEGSFPPGHSCKLPMSVWYCEPF